MEDRLFRVLVAFLTVGSASLQDPAMQDRLFRVLVAFSRHRPQVGYCQSMNFVAAFLLLVMEEEAAFWTLVTLVEDILCADVYAPSLE
eukprot:8175004-Pyramimonas_sp.AAC.1